MEGLGRMDTRTRLFHLFHGLLFETYFLFSEKPVNVTKDQ